MSNRKLPFGYEMSMGYAVINAPEANLVREIFEQYVLGASYNEITVMLKKQPIPYQPDKLWNKNMIARMLEDRRYIGEKDFPAIIQPDIFQRAEEKRCIKQRPTQKTPVQKLLNSLCKGRVTAEVEPQVLALLNGLVGNPQKIQPPPCPDNAAAQTAEIQRQLDAVMAQQPVDEDEANNLILRLAAAKYECLNSSEFETERLQRYFGGMVLMNELDAEVVRASMSSVQIRRGKVSLTLRNGQIIEMR